MKTIELYEQIAKQKKDVEIKVSFDYGYNKDKRYFEIYVNENETVELPNDFESRKTILHSNGKSHRVMVIRKKIEFAELV